MKIALIAPNNPYNIFRVSQMFKLARRKQLSAEELNGAVTDAWHEFYSTRKVACRLLTNRPPVTKGNLMVWALNLGIARIVRRYRDAIPVRASTQPTTVFEEMRQDA
jgi:hypothetical protein